MGRRGEPEVRTIREIAQEVRKDWSPVNYAARPYLDAMLELERITEKYYADSAESVVAYFLANAHTWRGETARRVKKELNQMIKGNR
jgi:hypothetical protein